MFRSNSTWKSKKPTKKNKLDVDNLWKNHREFIKNKKLILKSQQRFRTRKHNVFTEKVNKIALRASDDKRMQSIDSTETYPYGTFKGVVCKREKIKCNNMSKQCKKWLTLMMLKKKT